jgi:parvulin-like peptidyl-prolyl isomerase
MSRALIWPLVVAAFALGQEPPPAVSLRLIVVDSAAAAVQIRRQLEGGADFAVLAREKPIVATAVDGGLLGR